MAFNIMKNIKKGFSSKELVDDFLAALVGPAYVLIPTFLKLNGWMGFLVGFGLPFVLGKALDKPVISRAAVAIAGTHLTYVFGKPLAESLNPQQGSWALDEANIVSNATTTSGLFDGEQLPAGASVRRLPNGENVMVYEGSSMFGLSEYMSEPKHSGMYGYLPTAEGFSNATFQERA